MAARRKTRMAERRERGAVATARDGQVVALRRETAAIAAAASRKEVVALLQEKVRRLRAALEDANLETEEV